MDILIIGAAGMVGRKLAERLSRDGQLGGSALGKLVLADVIEPLAVPSAGSASSASSADLPIETMTIDLSEPGAVTTLLEHRCDVIFHLAAIVSGEAESDRHKGYRINLDGTRALFDGIAALHEQDGYTPRVVFTSSLAVFGAPLPDAIGDDFLCSPLTSYGTQKAMGELLLADYTRRGLLDGIGLRLPTVCIRPGKPNLAASGFFSGILREPINGRRAVLPVGDEVRHWFASPRAAVEFLLHASTLPGKRIGPRRNLNLPGLSATVGEQIAALERVVGADAVKLIERKPDPVVASIIAGWPESFDPQRAIQLGFVVESSFDEIIQVYLDDEMSAV